MFKHFACISNCRGFSTFAICLFWHPNSRSSLALVEYEFKISDVNVTTPYAEASSKRGGRPGVLDG